MPHYPYRDGDRVRIESTISGGTIFEGTLHEFGQFKVERSDRYDTPEEAIQEYEEKGWFL